MFLAVRHMKNSVTTTRPDTIREHHERVLRVMVMIRQRPDADLTLPALARAAHLSEFHFQRIFTQIAGESPAMYVRRVRLSRAAFELRASRAPIPAIAKRAGYARVEPFIRAFKSVFGATPGRFRDAAPAPLDRIPASIRVWVFSPAPDSQLRFTPIAAHSPEGRGYPAARYAELAPLRVAFLRAAHDAGPDRPRFERLAAFAAKRPIDEDLLFLTICFDEPGVVPSPRPERHLGVVVGPRRRGVGDIGVQTVGGGAYAVSTHAGSLAGLDQTTRWLRAAATRAGYAPRFAPIIHMLLDDPRRKPPGAPLVDVLVPVHPPKPVLRYYWRRRRPSP